MFRKEFSAEHGRGVFNIASRQQIGVSDILQLYVDTVQKHKLLKDCSADADIRMPVQVCHLFLKTGRDGNNIRIHAGNILPSGLA